jgi:hypothetical protein
LLHYAEVNKIAHWNEAHDLFSDADIIPFNELGRKTLYWEDFEPQTHLDDGDGPRYTNTKLQKIVIGFMTQEDISELIIV